MSESASGQDSQFQVFDTGKRHQGPESPLARYRYLEEDIKTATKMLVIYNFQSTMKPAPRELRRSGKEKAHVKSILLTGRGDVLLPFLLLLLCFCVIYTKGDSSLSTQKITYDVTRRGPCGGNGYCSWNIFAFRI